jgi:hypothetical protein
MLAYRDIYNAVWESQWLQEDKYGKGLESAKITAYNAWLLFKCIIQDDLTLYNEISDKIPESQIYTLNEYNDVLNCFRCAAVDIDVTLDYSQPPMDLNNKPYYYGVSTDGNLTAEEIQSVLTSDNTRSLGMEVEIGIGDPVYVYFVYPTEWGTVEEIILSGFNQVSAYDTEFDSVQYATLAGMTPYTVVRSLLTNDIDAPLTVQFK